MEKALPFTCGLVHVTPHHPLHSSSLCLYSLQLNPSHQVGEKLICEVSSSFSIPWPTNQSLCCVDLSVGFIICLLKKEPSPAEAESLH